MIIELNASCYRCCFHHTSRKQIGSISVQIEHF